MSTLQTKTFELDNLRVSLGATSLATFTSPPPIQSADHSTLCFPLARFSARPQNLIKRDPGGYKHEFQLQYKHY